MEPVGRRREEGRRIRRRLTHCLTWFVAALYTGTAARGSLAHRVLGDRTRAFVLEQGFVAVWGPETVTRSPGQAMRERRNRREGALWVNRPAARRGYRRGERPCVARGTPRDRPPGCRLCWGPACSRAAPEVLDGCR
jgi:hypothetical protein